MPEQTAANLFIKNALSGKPMTPFKHTQHRPMLYVDIRDVCKAFESLALVIIDDRFTAQEVSTRTINLMSPNPITIIDLAGIVQKTVRKVTSGRIKPRIKVIDKGVSPIYSPADKKKFKANISLATKILGIKELIKPQETIERIVRTRIGT